MSTITSETVIHGLTIHEILDRSDSYDIKQGYVFTKTAFWLNSVEFWTVVAESLLERGK